MHPSRRSISLSAAAAAGVAGALLLPGAAAAQEAYPPPAFGSGNPTFGTTFEPPAARPAPASLPSTGRDVRALVALGGLGVAGGGLVLLLARRPRAG